MNRYDDKYDVLFVVNKVFFRRDILFDVVSVIWMVRWRMFNDRNGDWDFVRNFIFFMIVNEWSDDIYVIWNEVEEVEKENINLYIVGFDLDDIIEIDEILIYLFRIYCYFINIREGDCFIDELMSNIFGFSKILLRNVIIINLLVRCFD